MLQFGQYYGYNLAALRDRLQTDVEFVRRAPKAANRWCAGGPGRRSLPDRANQHTKRLTDSSVRMARSWRMISVGDLIILHNLASGSRIPVNAAMTVDGCDSALVPLSSPSRGADAGVDGS